MRILTFRLSEMLCSAIFVTALILFANSTVSAQEEKPDFTGATSLACYIQTTNDNLGHLNGYLVRVDIQYQRDNRPRWNRPMRMYRVEDRKKAGQFCVSVYRQYFKEEQKQYEALQKQAQREAAASSVHHVSIKNSLASTF